MSSWIPFYKEMAEKVLNYKPNRIELVNLVKQAHSISGSDLPKIEADNNNIPDIDPFTVFALFNRGNQGDVTRIKLCEGFKQVLELKSDVPIDFKGIPTQNFDQFCYYRFLDDSKRVPACFDILWELFDIALNYSNLKSSDLRSAFENSFDQSIKLPVVGLSKLSMGLFCIGPTSFVGLDKYNKQLIEKEMHIVLGKSMTGGEYLSLCDSVIEYASSNMNLSLPEFSEKAYELNKKTDIAEEPSKAWLLTWNVDNWKWDDYANKCEMTKSGQSVTESWNCLSGQPKIGDDVYLMKQGKKPRGIIAHGIVKCEPYRKAHFDLEKANNGQTVKAIDVCFDRILNYEEDNILTLDTLKTDCSDKQIWSPRNSGNEINGTDVKLKLKQLWLGLTSVEAETLNNPDPPADFNRKQIYPKNILLFGPPGTGKTYNTVRYAVAIIEEKEMEQINAEKYEDVFKRYLKYKEQGLIEFTTFHQSYGYEEFIEGIKPDTIDDTGGMTYKVEPGVFLRFCKSINQEEKEIDPFESSWQRLEKVVYDQGKEYQFTRPTGSKFKAVLVDNGFRVYWKTGVFNALLKSAIKEQWEQKINRETQTGGSIWAFDARQAVLDEMHNKYGLPKFEKVNLNRPKQNKVFIIDEINRGNVSKVFGELITLIEDTKRFGKTEGVPVTLPYSGEAFIVPDNIYIIGTMNTADRSIAALDTALRRRFTFIEMLPDSSTLGDVDVEGVKVCTILKNMNQKISILYDREHTIGHAYFIPLLQDNSIENLANIFANKIVPLLQEYFYEDYDKIRLVFGDNKKEAENTQFIIKHRYSSAEIFGEDIDDIDESVTYEININAFYNIDSYKSI